MHSACLILEMLFSFSALILLAGSFDNRLPYNLYCVGGDVKHCSIQSNLTNALVSLLCYLLT